MGQIDIVAVITPKPDKVDRAIEILTAMAAAVQAREPNTLKYHLHRQLNPSATSEADKYGNELYMIETYVDHAAHEAHRQSPDFQNLVKSFQEEEILEKEMVIYACEPIGGFAARAGGPVL